ncbi:MAG: hypothetical protein A2176_10035 [Spirochaetes bacterium RBG_13_51_14]|nr:MAG: hypothetical protein A2176_10035 [Spirochaetes bacterium RBG_13_51_14]
MLFVSLLIHVFFLARYIQTRNQDHLQRYIITTISNVILSGSLMFVALYKPEEIQKIKFSLLMWLISGFILVAMLLVQILIFIKIYQRSKMPEHYHYNFFGRKVLHASVAKTYEVGIFFASIPLMLLAGAYFVAKLLRFFI